CAKVPLAIERLRPLIPLPHAEPDRPMSGLSRLVYAFAHQCLSDAMSEPFAGHIQPYQFNGLWTIDALLRLTGTKHGITRRKPTNFGDQKGRRGIGQLSHLLFEIEGFSEICSHFFR